MAETVGGGVGRVTEHAMREYKGRDDHVSL